MPHGNVRSFLWVAVPPSSVLKSLQTTIYPPGVFVRALAKGLRTNDNHVTCLLEEATEVIFGKLQTIHTCIKCGQRQMIRPQTEHGPRC